MLVCMYSISVENSIICTRTTSRTAHVFVNMLEDTVSNTNLCVLCHVGLFKK